MAEQKQTIVQPSVPPNKSLGARRESNLQSMFPNSPIFSGQMSDEERRKSYQGLSLDGNVNDTVEVAGSPVPGGQGHGVNSHDRDYSDAPDLANVETGGAGKPSSAFTPNLTSPGPGSINPADQPEYNGTIPDGETKINFGSGLGGTASPAVTSAEISGQTILGTYISGKSYAGSDGQS